MKSPSWLILSLAFLLVNCSATPQEESAPHPLILISVDGLRPDYLDRTDTPNFDYLIEKGVLAKHMIPIFPTKTFPNHYSLVTGLYAENTGVVANNMYDKTIGQRYTMSNRAAVMDPRWYGGEPIWVTAEKQNMRAGTLFWPGSEAPIMDTYATHWLQYDDDMPHDARVDTVISWLQNPVESRPTMLTFYVSQVDTYGHRYGPESDSVDVALLEVDRTLGYLIDELKRIEVWPDVHILITSDHGMTEVSNERVILLDELIDLKLVDVIDWSPVAMLEPKDFANRNDIYEKLKSSESNYKVFMKRDIPSHYRIANHPRTPEIMMVADLGYTITTSENARTRIISGGAHGYDHHEPEMRSFFLGYGPNLKQSSIVEPFQSIHVYELMTNLLHLTPARNNGSLDSIKTVLR